MASRSSENRTRSKLKPLSIFFSALLAASAFLAVASAQTPERARTEALAKRAGDRLVALQREADRLASEETSLLNNLRKLEIDHQIKNEQLKQAGSAAADVQREIVSLGDEIDALQATEQHERPELNARLVEMYK